ncbi:restriction endonuclease [Porcipelethomonas sp.]|uniref:restriction endonuclease n=1 Tax=Porcipelethomonas sp. TaxID=2981675 RepID=UPI003EF0F3E2
MGKAAFMRSGLAFIDIPNSVVEIGNEAFSCIPYSLSIKLPRWFESQLERIGININCDDIKFKSSVSNEYSCNKTSFNNITIDDVDLMSGVEFEEFLVRLFTSMGFGSFSTKTTGDQGIDVIADKNGVKYGIQAKCYSGTVGNSAVQEAFSGKVFYNLDKVIVVTNNTFTKSAVELATKTNVILWDRTILIDKLHYLNT